MSIASILADEGVALSKTPNATDEHIAEMRGTFRLEGIELTDEDIEESRAVFEGRMTRAQVLEKCRAEIREGNLK